MVKELVGAATRELSVPVEEGVIARHLESAAKSKPRP